MTIYVITDLNIIENIKRALDRGISIEIYIYLPDSAQGSKAFHEIFRMKNDYNYLIIHEINDEVLHAKVLIADTRKVVLGSANLTFHGMVKNYELGFILEDIGIAHQILTILKRLISK